MKKYDILEEYFYSELCRLEQDVEDKKQAVRYRRITALDCLELLIAMERYSAFVEYMAAVKSILSIGMKKTRRLNN